MNLALRPILWRAENVKPSDESPLIDLFVQPIQWNPTPPIRVSVEVLEGDDADREWAFFSGSAT